MLEGAARSFRGNSHDPPFAVRISPWTTHCPADQPSTRALRAPHHGRRPGGLRVVGHHRPARYVSGAIADPDRQPPRRSPHFTSPQYGYTETSPANWYSGGQATERWDGKGAPGDEDSVVDLFHGPDGVEAWAVAAPTKQSLAAYSRTTTQAAAAEHPCPAIPQTDQAITIGGVPARLLGMQCPPGSGFLVETAVTIHDGTGFVFTSQNPTGGGDKSADRAAFRRFLAGIRF